MKDRQRRTTRCCRDVLLGLLAQGRRRILRQLLFVYARPLYFELVEQHGRGHDAVRNVRGAVLHTDVVTGGNQIAAHGAGIEISETSAAHQLFVSILGPDFVEQPGGELRTKSLHAVAVGKIALAAKIQKLALERLFGQRLGRSHDQVAVVRAGRSHHAWDSRRQRSAAVTIRVRKVPNGLPADQVVHQRALFDQRHALRRNPFVVYFIMTEQRLAAIRRNGRVSRHGKKLRQHAALIACSKGSGGARVLAQLGPAAQDVLPNQVGKHSDGGIGRKQHRSPILLIHNGRVAQVFQSSSELPGAFYEIGGGRQFFDIRHYKAV